MEVDRSIFLKAFVITVLLFISLYSLNVYLNSQREVVLDARMNEILEEFDEVQALTSLMKVFGENATCLTLKSRMKLLDTKIWKLGDKIDSYRQISRDYMNDPYYQIQKEKFNRQEVIYFTILKEMKSQCDLNQTEVLYFYRNSQDCKQCDDQSYVLNYYNNRIDPEIATFSFDADLNLTSVDVLLSIYNVTEYPCIVVEGDTNCGLQNSDQMKEILCRRNNLSIC
ncbi:MAG: hypothetical protein NTU61_03465 [Candidatus Altiarchaeota archaeon]|nr:hypothetical protein [Candidatus Altiarchaeota archaeon]